MSDSKKIYELYIDESGTPDFAHHDRNYTLCGIVLRSEQSSNLELAADKLKYKYWGNTPVVFHSNEIGNKSGSFTNLRDVNVDASFKSDLYKMLMERGFSCIVVSINKTTAQANGWTEGDVLKTAFSTMIEVFLRFLSTYNCKGRIVMESSGGKDVVFYRQYSKYLSKGCVSLSLTHNDVKKLLTSISFVSKNNHDIEEQVADLFAYPATRQCLHNEGIAPLHVGSYEERMCNILQTKLLKVKGTVIGFVRLP